MITFTSGTLSIFWWKYLLQSISTLWYRCFYLNSEPFSHLELTKQHLMSCSFHLEKSVKITVLRELCARLCLGQPCPNPGQETVTHITPIKNQCVVFVRFFLPNPLHETHWNYSFELTWGPFPHLLLQLVVWVLRSQLQMHLSCWLHSQQSMCIIQHPTTRRYLGNLPLLQPRQLSSPLTLLSPAATSPLMSRLDVIRPPAKWELRHNLASSLKLLL